MMQSFKTYNSDLLLLQIILKRSIWIWKHMGSRELCILTIQATWSVHTKETQE